MDLRSLPIKHVVAVVFVIGTFMDILDDDRQRRDPVDARDFGVSRTIESGHHGLPVQPRDLDPHVGMDR
jgi:hypothetical protein